MVIAQRDVELVEDEEADRWIAHQLTRLAPGAFGGGDITGAILRLPGKAFTERVPRDLLPEPPDRLTLARLPGACADPHYTDAEAPAESAEHTPACRSGHAL